MLSRSAGHYLIPPPEYFWRWDAEDHAAVWSDGSTMAFASELLPLLRELAQEIGLPPLGSILIVLAFVKQPDEWPDKWPMLTAFARTLGDGPGLPTPIAELESDVRFKLRQLAALPEDLRSGQSAKLHLLHTLFAPTFNRLLIDESCEIVDQFRAATVAQLAGENDVDGEKRLIRDLKALASAMEEWSSHSLEAALRTGLRSTSLDDAFTNDNLALPKAEGSLWSDLEQSQDDELRAVASLARQLLAVIQIPRPLHQADDQPVGGVSDLTNKGDPARLLLSELAWDSDTLAVRLAFNEALYLRRETPPATPLPQRYILLDNGILLWGRPRIYATAVALALLKPRTMKEEVELRGHHARSFTTMNLACVGDLSVWWSRLDASPNCGLALDEALLELLADKPELQPEIILITHADGAKQLMPKLAAREWPAGGRFFVITVNGDGLCVMQQRTQMGAREIASVKLDPPKALQST